VLRIGAIGHLNMDIYVKVEKLPDPDSRETCKEHYISVGGAATNYSITLSKLGVESHLFVSRGTDIIGDLLENTLTNMKIIVHSKKVSDHTGMVIVIVDEKGIKYMISIPGANKFLDISEDDVEILKKLDHVHVVVSEREVLERILEKLSDLRSLSLGFRTEIAKLGVGFLLKICKNFRIIFLNKPEAELLFSTKDLEEIKRKCREIVENYGICDEIVITLGEEGSIIYGRGGIELMIPAFKVNVVDTTGAGDVFAAVYTFSRLIGLDCSESSIFASAYAALKCMRRGASNVPPVEDVISFLDKQGYHAISNKVRNIFSKRVNL